MPRSHSLFYSIWGFSRSTADLTSFPRIFGPSQPIKKQQDIVHSQTGMNWPIKGKMSKACCLLFLLKFHCFSNAVNWPLLIRNWRGLIMDGFLFTNLQDWIKNKMRKKKKSQASSEWVEKWETTKEGVKCSPQMRIIWIFLQFAKWWNSAKICT